MDWLIKRLGIHEHEFITIDIQELPGLALDTHLLDIFACAETQLDHAPVAHIFQTCAHECAPVSRTNMMKFNERIQLAVIADDHAVTKIRCCCSSQWTKLLFLLSIILLTAARLADRTDWQL